MRKRKALVRISLMLFLVALNVFLYAQPSIEDLAGKIENLEKIVGELSKDILERDSLIKFMEGQMEGVYNNANGAIESLESSVSALSIFVGFIGAIIVVGFPVVSYLISQKQSRIEKERLDSLEKHLDMVGTEAENASNSLEEKNSELEKKVQEMRNLLEKTMKSAEEAKQWADKSKTSELFSKALASEDLDKMIEIYTQVIDRDPINSPAYNNRGVAHSKKQRHEKAIDDYSEAIRLDPEDTVAYYNRGIEYSKMGEHDLAITNFREAIRINPKDSRAHNNLASQLRIKQKLGEAKEHAQKAIKFDPSSSEAYGTLAEVYSDLGETDRFYEYLAQALEKKYKLLELLKDDDDCKPVYAKHKDEERFKELMKKHNIEVPDDVWK